MLSLLPSNKVKCLITGHEMKPDLETISAHLKGKKFMKAIARRGDDLGKFLPYIVPDVENETKMFCKLTAFSLNPIATEIERHMQGKKFRRLKVEYDEKEKLKAQKLKEKEDKKKEREEMEKEGIWIPDESMLESDEEEKEGEGEDGTNEGDAAATIDDDDDNGMDQDEDKDEDDEESVDDWIITTQKLEIMKRNGIAKGDEQEQEQEKGKGIEKKEKKKRTLAESTTKKKARGGGAKNKRKPS